MLTPTYIRGEIMREELLKMARDYLNRVTVEELKRDLIECGVNEIKPSPCPIYERNGVKNLDSDNRIDYSIEEPHYFKDSNSECLGNLYFKGNNLECIGGSLWTMIQTAS